MEKEALTKDKTSKRRVYVYFISFFYKQGRDTGFACYEQPMLEKVEGIGQLMISAQNYGRQLQDQVKQSQKNIPWWKFWIRMNISTKPFTIYPIEYKLLREDLQKIPVAQPVNDNITQVPTKAVH